MDPHLSDSVSGYIRGSHYLPSYVHNCIPFWSIPCIGMQWGVAVLPAREHGRSCLYQDSYGLLVVVSARQVQGRVLIIVLFINIES